MIPLFCRILFPLIVLSFLQVLAAENAAPSQATATLKDILRSGNQSKGKIEQLPQELDIEEPPPFLYALPNPQPSLETSNLPLPSVDECRTPCS